MLIQQVCSVKNKHAGFVVFLYTNNKIPKKEIKKSILFIMDLLKKKKP